MTNASPSTGDAVASSQGRTTLAEEPGKAIVPVAPAKQTVAKFSQLFKDKNIIKCIVKYHPLIWLKLKMCSRLFAWRLPDDIFTEMLSDLNNDLGLTSGELNVHEVAQSGCIDSMWLLTIQGLSVRQKCPFSGATLLQKSIHSGNMNLIQMLLIKNANPNVKGAYGYTALHECSYVGTGHMCAILLQHKANVDAISKNGSTPLLVAAREGHTEIVNVLLAGGAHPDDGGDKGWSPLFIAAGEGHLEVVQSLLQYQANPLEVSATENRTPLEEAWHNKQEAVAVLLESHIQQRHGGAALTAASQQQLLLSTQMQIQMLTQQRTQLEQHFLYHPNDPVATREMQLLESQLESQLALFYQQQAASQGVSEEAAQGHGIFLGEPTLVSTGVAEATDTAEQVVEEEQDDDDEDEDNDDAEEGETT
ncbi:unnamed protein product [Amoebophrya sp. A25]|nr:unnamed protein product [Amoebophrya sp. A25]|eukprot:GSA25T00027408001.1